MNKGYLTIDAVETQNEATPLHDDVSPRPTTSNSTTNKGTILIAAIAGITCLFALSSFTSARRTNQTTLMMAESDILRAAKVPNCPIALCFTNGCSPAAPFKCHDQNGCSATPWYPGSCRNQCSLEYCTGDIPDGSPTCEGVKCPGGSCKNYQKCGASAPYQCLSGASANGCNADPFEWTMRTTENTCSECCDTSTCS